VDGAVRTAPKSVAIGSNGASHGAPSAINAPTTARASAAAGRRRSRRTVEGRRATATVAGIVLTPSLEGVD